jgi:hypothetical protein
MVSLLMKFYLLGSLHYVLYVGVCYSTVRLGALVGIFVCFDRLHVLVVSCR